MKGDIYIYIYIYGGVSKLWSLFGSPKLGPYYNRDPKRDHNFDNPPYIKIMVPFEVLSIIQHLISRVPKKGDHNFDIFPYV